MSLMTKRMQRWLLVLIIVHALALVVLASLAMRQLNDDYPWVVKIQQYTYQREAGLPEGLQYFTNMLRYKFSTRMHYLDIRSTLGASCLVLLLAGTLVLFEKRGAPEPRGSFASGEKHGRKRYSLRLMTLIDYALYLTVLILTCIVWSVFNDSLKKLEMDNPLLPKHHVNETVPYGPVPKNEWFTFETWNCALVPYVSFDPEPGPSRAFITRRCAQLKATRLLILPLLVASSVRVVIITWTQRYTFRDRKRDKAARDEASDPLLETELASNHVHRKAKTPACEGFEAPALDAPEMPGSAGRVAEVPGSRVAELPGDEWHNELEAEGVAVEASTK